MIQHFRLSFLLAPLGYPVIEQPKISNHSRQCIVDRSVSRYITQRLLAAQSSLSTFLSTLPRLVSSSLVSTVISMRSDPLSPRLRLVRTSSPPHTIPRNSRMVGGGEEDAVPRDGVRRGGSRLSPPIDGPLRWTAGSLERAKGRCFA
jgi:hypothetical protein